jgi:hypothetical protein
MGQQAAALIQPSSDPTVAEPLPSESLASLVYRHARGNGYAFAHLIEHLDLNEYMRTRVVDKAAARRVAAFLNLDTEQVMATTLAVLPPAVVGNADPRSRGTDPMGWAIPNWSSRCVDCHADGAPWDVLHQTGLVWICPRHQRHLRIHCRQCVPGYARFTRDVLECHLDDHPAQTSPPDLDELEAQRQVLLLLTRAATDPQPVRTLRAGAVFFALEQTAARLSRDGADHVSVAAPTQARARSADQLRSHGRRQPGELILSDLSFNPRYAHTVPAVLGDHLRGALQHQDDNGEIDSDWARSVWRTASLTEQARGRLRPFARELGAVADRARPRPSANSRRTAVFPHPGWRKILQGHATQLARLGLTGVNIPASTLDRSNPFGSYFIPALSLSVVLRTVLCGETATTAIRDFGGMHRHITSVRAYLCEPPPHDQIQLLDQAIEELLGQPLCDYAALRLRQGEVHNVSDVVLRQLGLQPPHNALVPPGMVAAVWLWTVVTGSHHVLAPFVDGRRLRRLIGELSDWHRSCPPQALAALLDWNMTENLSDLGDMTSAASRPRVLYADAGPRGARPRYEPPGTEASGA